MKGKDWVCIGEEDIAVFAHVCARARGVSDGEGWKEGVGLGGGPAVWPYAPAFSCLFSMADQRAHLHWR